MSLRKIILATLLVFMLISLLVFALVGCKPTPPADPEPDPNPSPIGPGDNQEDQNVVINFADPTFKLYAEEGFLEFGESIISRIRLFTGVTIEMTTNKDEARIHVIAMDPTHDVEDIRIVGKYSVTVENENLTIRATDVKAIQFALSRLYKMMGESGMNISTKFRDAKTFDNFKSSNSYIVELNEADIDGLALVDQISLGNKVISGFNPYTTEYAVSAPGLSGYPLLTARAASANATISVVQPEDNGGIGLITVKNGDKTQVYTVIVTLANVYMNASVINKNNTKGTITFVIDDGDKDTASFVVNEMFPKYQNINATFALITNALASLQKDNVNNEWKKDANGNYLYTVNKTEADFWREIHASGRVSFSSHSQTHAYWGENDDGGSFEYTLNNGSTAISKVFPKGNVTAELLASQQILRDLFGVESNTFVMPGVGAKLSDYYYNLLKTAGFYIGARNTANKPGNMLSMVGFADDFATTAGRFNIKGYMIEHYNTSASMPTNSSSTNADCLAAGIPYWTEFIDTAITEGGWACFCIHLIKPDDYVGSTHYIYESQADALFAYADAYGDDVWFATLDEASEYYFLRSTTTVTAQLVDNFKMTVALSDKETSRAYDDVTLTVRVSVPSYWTSAKVGDTDCEILEDEEGKYIILDLVRYGYATVTGDGEMVGDEADFEYIPVDFPKGDSLALPGKLTLSDSTLLYYDAKDPESLRIANVIASALESLSGKRVVLTPDTDGNIKGKYLRLLPIGSRDSLSLGLSKDAGSLSAYKTYMYDEGLCICATDAMALSSAADALLALYSGGELTADALAHYLDSSGNELSHEVLRDDTTLSEIVLGGVPIRNFDPDQREYTIEVDMLDGYPRVEYFVHFGASSVSISAPTKENGGVCRIAVSSESGLVGVYKITLVDIAKSISAEVVHKNGADGVVTFVFDDGNHGTAKYVVNDVMSRYDKVTVTLGLVMNKVCTLVYDEAGDCWLKDEHGNYIYVPNTSEVEFWREIISNGRVELLSHSYSHAYWGEDDGGGIFQYVDNTGAIQTSVKFPKGNVTAELAASKQMLKDLFDMDSHSYILPGLRVQKLSDYYYNLVENGGYYIGARSGFAISAAWSMRNATQPKDMADISARYKVPALTTQYFSSNHNKVLSRGLSNSTYLANGIDAWEQYIDNAINQHGWACFLLHFVINDTDKPSDYAIFRSQADALFAYADSYGDRLWIATYDEAQIYYNQWSTSTVKAMYAESRIRVDLTHKEVGDMYDMAMTVRVNLPDSWDSAYLNGTELEIISSSSGNYVLIDVTPDVPAYVTLNP